MKNLRFHGGRRRCGPCLPVGRSSSGSAGSVWPCPFGVCAGVESLPGWDVAFVVVVVVSAVAVAIALVVAGPRIRPGWPTKWRGT